MDNPSHAAKMLAASFGTAIIVGALLLLLPISTAAGGHTGVIDALFTATSAVCVTGLITVDTGTHYSLFGQAVILGLFQLGGLGIMTYSVFLGLMFRRGAGLRQSQVIRDTFGIYTGTLGGLLVRIILLAISIEAIGAVLLYVHWKHAMPADWPAAWYAVFHAVSAFCNAGFSTFSDSLMSFRSDPIVNLVIVLLIIIGGLGFVVLMEVPKVFFSVERRRVSLHTRTVLTATGLLLVIGMTAIYLLESMGMLSLTGGAEGLMEAFFQSVTARTAGFNTIDIGSLHDATLMVIIFLMFIGASPGSTGGGIKTTTASIFLVDFLSYLRGRNPELWGRTIPHETVEKAFLIITICLATVLVSTFGLLITDPQFEFINILFEATSAFGTVGLSTGITGGLSSLGKIIIIVTMFAGRLGPLTLALAVGGRVSKGIFQYPEGNIYVG